MEKFLLIICIICCSACSPVLIKYKHQSNDFYKMKIVLLKDSTGYLESKYLQRDKQTERQNFSYRSISKTKLYVIADSLTSCLKNDNNIEPELPNCLYIDPTKAPTLRRDTITFDNRWLYFSQPDSLKRYREPTYIFKKGSYKSIYRQISKSSYRTGISL